MNVLLIEDHPIFRFGVRQLIYGHWPEAAIGEATSLAEALELLCNSSFQIAVADLNLPDTHGLEVLTQLLRKAPAMKILVLSLNSEKAYAQRALQMGAAGYLAKAHASDELIVALDRIAAGGRYITATLAEQLADQLSRKRSDQLHDELSDQEYRVMIQLAEGLRVADIADGMNLSPKTISTYRSRVLEKLNLTSNAEIARYCLTHQLTTEAK